MDLLTSEFSSLLRFLKEHKVAFSDLRFTHLACFVDRNLNFFLNPTTIFLFIFGQCGDNFVVNKIHFWKEKIIGVTVHLTLLNPGKAIAMAIWPNIFHFIT